MGGRESIRGYVYQTIISVIQSLTDSTWQFLQIEPDTENNKVDIIWENGNGKKCQQIKSSINNFQKSDIIRWLEELINDSKGFISFELILIGSSSQETRDFINKISSKKAIEGSDIINQHITNIDIELYPFRQDLLESKITLEVLTYLEKIQVNVKTSAGNLIKGGLIYQFLQFSIVGKRVSKEDFNNYFKNWVETNYSKEVIREKVSEFKVQHYDPIQNIFTTSAKGKKLLFDTPSIIKKQILVINTAYKAALEIKLPKRSIKVEDESDNPLQLSKLMRSFSEPSESEIDEDMKRIMATCLKSYFGITLNEDFYNVGDLMREPLSTMSFFMPGRDYKGTEKEIDKNQKLRKLYWEVLTLNELVKFVEYLKSFFILSLVITNTGEIYDEDVIVDLMFPKDIGVIDFKNILVPDDYDSLSILIKDEFLKKNLELKANSRISGYEDLFIPNYKPFEDLDLMYQLGGGSKRLENRKEHFLRQVDHLFEHEVFYDSNDYTLLKYTFKKINPNIYVYFPSLILIEASQNFTFEYSITSKHSGKIYKGSLNYEITNP